MADVFSEIDLSDNAAPTAGDSPPDVRARRRGFRPSLKHVSSSPLTTNVSSSSLFFNNSFHELSSQPPPSPSALLDNSSNSSSLGTSSNMARFSSPSPPLPTTLPSDLSLISPTSLLRTGAYFDLTMRPFNFSTTRHDSIIDSLLSSIYERDGSSYGPSSSQDSDTVTTVDFCTDQSSSIHPHSKLSQQLSGESTTNNENTVCSKSSLATKSIQELRHLCIQMQQQIGQTNAILLKHLRHRDKHLSKLQRNCDIITAILQAASLKRREDTTMRFSLSPSQGEKGFQQWKDAISVAARMPGGLLPTIRQKLWISLATNYIRDIHLDWEKTCRFAFNNCSNPDDDQLGIQIVKDLHRTGCSWSSNEHDRATLKRVLLAFARYNKSIGYCQGLNILAAVILDVVDMNEEQALMILIYLIDSVLPNFFANNLRALAIDMAVFREWLRIYNNKLHIHLQTLQSSSYDASGAIYEPPLLNVFTIQWFLTLFATCLPRRAALRVWDALMIEGSEVLFRTGLVLWSKLSISVLKVSSADQFYSAMGLLSVQLLDEKIIDADNLIRDIYNFGPFPTPILAELRQKFSFNITPFQQLSAAGVNTVEGDKTKQSATRTNSDETKPKDSKRSKTKHGPVGDDETGTTVDDEIVNFMSCFAILSSPSRANRLEYHSGESTSTNNNNTALSRLTPGAYSSLPATHKTPSIEDSLSLDISQLKRQYKKLKERSKQAQIIIQTASNEQQRQRSRAPSIHPSDARYRPMSTTTSAATEPIRRPTVSSLSSIEFSAPAPSPRLPSSVCSMTGGPLINHLFLKPADIKRNQYKKSVSIKSSASRVDQQAKKSVSRVVIEPPLPPPPSSSKQRERSIEEEAEEANELQQEIEQLLSSLNLEKPLSSSTEQDIVKVSNENVNSRTIDEDTIQLETVARTLYDYQKAQVTTETPVQTPSDVEKTPSSTTPNLIDRYLNSRSVHVPKYSSFNPFPSRSFNENVAVNGYKLGLYAPDPSTR